MKFVQTKWKSRNDIDYNHREFMIEDLKKNYLKPNLKYSDVVKLLGKNQYNFDNDFIQLQYEIYVDCGFDIDPVETKTFIINFNSDSVFVNSRVDYWKK